MDWRNHSSIPSKGKRFLAHTVSHSVENKACSSSEISGDRVKLNTHLSLVPTIRMHEDRYLVFHIPSWRVDGQLCLYLRVPIKQVRMCNISRLSQHSADSFGAVSDFCVIISPNV